MLTDPDAAKRTLRAVLRTARVHVGADALIECLLALPMPSGVAVAGISPLPGEPDLMPAWNVLHKRGHAMLLPETTPPGEPLIFRRWHPDAVLHPGRYGTLHPAGPPADPDIVFVPLLAWDRSMARLGYGGGYYDRTLAARPDAIAIGTGFAAQEVARVPTGPYDVPLDAVLTERGLVMAEGQSFENIVSGRHRRP